jgi:SNF2 family DNA or RNA helicase
MGTGKTSSSAWALDYLMNKNLVKRVLIICPLSIMQSAWQNDLFKTVMHRRVGIAHGTAVQRKKVILSDAEIVIINFDGVEIALNDLLRGKFDMVIIDEASAIKRQNTNRWKAINQLLTPDSWLWLMTGTPAAQSPVDAYGLVRMMHPHKVDRTEYLFKDRVMQKVSTFTWRPRPEANAYIHQLMQPAIRFTKEECLDLPELMYQTRDVPLTKQQQKYYDTLKREMLLEVAGNEITSVNAAVNMNKLLQISCISVNTEVLSNSGWKKIQDISPNDKVWDGEEWVSCGGSVFMGDKPVIECFGVHMTTDHKVLTTNGWVEAGEIVYGKHTNRFIREAVRLPNCYSQKRYINRKSKESSLVMSVPMWKSCNKRKPILTIKAQKINAKLWMPSWKRNAQDVMSSSILKLPQYDKSLHKSAGQRLSQLWSQRNLCVRKLDAGVYAILGRYGNDIPKRANLRPHRRERPILTNKLQMGYVKRTSKQYANEFNTSHSKGVYDCLTSSRNLRGKSSNFIQETASGMANRISSDCTTQQEQATFDILNCGPRNRFVVQGSEGSLIVHNCGGVYTDNGEVIDFDCKTRYNELVNVIEDSSHSVLVFCAFRHSIAMLQEKLVASGYDVDVIHGGVTLKNRTEIFDKFQTSGKKQVLVIQPQSASHGVTLHAANTVVWWSPTTSYETYAQANARVHRAGQKNPCTVVHLQGSPVEKHLYTALQTRESNQINLLGMYKSLLSS